MLQKQKQTVNFVSCRYLFVILKENRSHFYSYLICPHLQVQFCFKAILAQETVVPITAKKGDDQEKKNSSVMQKLEYSPFHVKKQSGQLNFHSTLRTEEQVKTVSCIKYTDFFFQIKRNIKDSGN